MTDKNGVRMVARQGVGGSSSTTWADEAMRLLSVLVMRQGGHPERPRVRHRTIEAWLPLAERLARRYSGRAHPMDDLVQCARVGLIKAVDGFDPARGEDFAGYAVPTIVGELKRHFRDHGWALRMPRRLQDLSMQVAQARQALMQRLGQSPSVTDIAVYLRVSEDDVRAAVGAAAAQACVSLSSPRRAGDGGTVELMEVLGAWDPGLEAADDKMTLDGLLHRLPAREQRILAMRFYGNQTQHEIAAHIGVSQMHVSRLLNKSLSWLRDQMTVNRPTLSDSAVARVEGQT